MPTAAWEEARCMHGNPPWVCFELYCRHPELVNGQQAWNRNDVQELEKRNRDSCTHDGVPNRLTPEEFELAIARAPSLGPVKLLPFDRCPACQGLVPVRDESNQPNRSQMS